VIRINAISPGYLRALGMKLLRGRWLGVNDSGVLLNESMARQTFGGLDPIGRQIGVPRPATIVGIVTDLKYSRLDQDAEPEAFVALERIPPRFNMSIAARVTGSPAAAARALACQVAAIDPTQPVFAVKTLDQALSDSLAPRRFNLFLLGAFAAAAVLLALVGVYGVMAYAVAERTREIGVRMALGAREAQVVGMVAREAGMVAGGGIAAGLVAAWGATRVMANLLYGVAPDDPAVFAAVAASLGFIAMAACIRPARAAASIDPAIALRAE
jgi:putative ABC transport system permease protein